jgi:hypothetical protein
VQVLPLGEMGLWEAAPDDSFIRESQQRKSLSGAGRVQRGRLLVSDRRLAETPGRPCAFNVVWDCNQRR